MKTDITDQGRESVVSVGVGYARVCVCSYVKIARLARRLLGQYLGDHDNDKKLQMTLSLFPAVKLQMPSDIRLFPKLVVDISQTQWNAADVLYFVAIPDIILLINQLTHCLNLSWFGDSVMTDAPSCDHLELSIALHPKIRENVIFRVYICIYR